MRIVSGISLAAVLLAVGVQTAAAQAQLGEDRWYWGVEGGAVMFKQTKTDKWRGGPTVGVNWFITKGQVALFAAFDELILPSYTTTSIANASSATGFTAVTFDRAQRLSAMLFAMPGHGPLRLNLGGGFAIDNITNAATTATGAELQAATQAIDQLRAAAFFTADVGFQYRSSRMMLYVDYRYMPSSVNYLIPSAQHALVGGIRYAFTASHTEVTTSP
jgi:hypothetical protein